MPCAAYVTGLCGSARGALTSFCASEMTAPLWPASKLLGSRRRNYRKKDFPLDGGYKGDVRNSDDKAQNRPTGPVMTLRIGGGSPSGVRFIRVVKNVPVF